MEKVEEAEWIRLFQNMSQEPNYSLDSRLKITGEDGVPNWDAKLDTVQGGMSLFQLVNAHKGFNPDTGQPFIENDVRLCQM